MLDRARRPKLTGKEFVDLLGLIDLIEETENECYQTSKEHGSRENAACNLKNVRRARRLREVLKPTKKKCGNCFKVKSITDFYVSRAKGEAQHRCKACNAEVCRSYEERIRRSARERKNYAQSKKRSKAIQ